MNEESLLISASVFSPGQGVYEYGQILDKSIGNQGTSWAIPHMVVQLLWGSSELKAPLKYGLRIFLLFFFFLISNLWENNVRKVIQQEIHLQKQTFIL